MRTYPFLHGVTASVLGVVVACGGRSIQDPRSNDGGVAQAGAGGATGPASGGSAGVYAGGGGSGGNSSCPDICGHFSDDCGTACLSGDNLGDCTFDIVPVNPELLNVTVDCEVIQVEYMVDYTVDERGRVVLSSDACAALKANPPQRIDVILGCPIPR